MSICPFAKYVPVNYSAGSYTPGPFRIVHHTTEGSTAASALSVFKVEYAPHFVVDQTTIYQLVNTLRPGSAMRNESGGVQTNREGALQIEIVGFAGKAKDIHTLENVRKLCRWLEQEHGVPKVWPNGFCIPAVNGRDSNKHNRDPHVWATQGGHYGHEHVPENIHWDPAYTLAETVHVMSDSPLELTHVPMARIIEGPDETYRGCPH